MPAGSLRTSLVGLLHSPLPNWSLDLQQHLAYVIAIGDDLVGSGCI